MKILFVPGVALITPKPAEMHWNAKTGCPVYGEPPLTQPASFRGNPGRFTNRMGAAS